MNLFIFDLDGVIYIGNTLLPGVKETLQELERRGEKICFLSNNSTLSRESYCKKLTRWGLKVKDGQFFSSSYLCALYLKNYRKIKPEEKVMIVGEKGLFEELKNQGIAISQDPKKVSFVAVGMDRKLNFKKLCLAHRAILNGADFIATNTDATYPLEEKTIPGSGAIVRALEASTKKAPFVLGKPETFGLKIVLQQMGFSPSQVILVGDRLDTDIALGNKMGIVTVLVLSGISSSEEVEKVSPLFRPCYVISALPQLLSINFS
ncbi:HAD-IIA family hydrolase [Candidatus Aerophobetes bacterium]|nr:HAD-IIA family hydrolase [Candidatus Aerophobetes bacterium]